jgi:hypothetical protein
VLLVLVALLGLAGAVTIALSGGAYEAYPRTRLLTGEQRSRAADWTRPCWPTAPWSLLGICSHVAGRVVWIERKDPDRDGDRHLIVMSRLHPRIVKVSRELAVSRLPKIGTRIDAVGWRMTGSSGRNEVDAIRLVPGGPAGR